MNNSISTSLITLLIIGVLATGLWFERSPWSPVLNSKVTQLILQQKEDQALRLLLWQSEHALTEPLKVKPCGKQRFWQVFTVTITIKPFLCSSDVSNSQVLSTPQMPMPVWQVWLAEPMPRTAAEYWQLAIQANPDHSMVAQWWINVANTYELIGDDHRAVDAWEQVMAYDDSISIARISLGRLQLNTDPDVALQHFYTLKGHAAEGKTATLGTQLALWELERQGVLADSDD